MDFCELASKIFDSFEYLKRILVDKGYCEEDRIVIFDDPIEIIIKRDSIVFLLNGVEEGVITRNYASVSEEIREEVAKWLEGLTSLKFKRFSLKRR